MQRIHAWTLSQIAQGRTVLVYNVGVTAKTAKHVRCADRVELRGDLMYLDNECVKGCTVALKP